MRPLVWVKYREYKSKLDPTKVQQGRDGGSGRGVEVGHCYHEKRLANLGKGVLYYNYYGWCCNHALGISSKQIQTGEHK